MAGTVSRIVPDGWFTLLSQTPHQLQILFGEKRDGTKEGRKLSAVTSLYAGPHPKLLSSFFFPSYFFHSFLFISSASLLFSIPVLYDI
jgi:hypothetical protein